MRNIKKYAKVLQSTTAMQAPNPIISQPSGHIIDRYAATNTNGCIVYHLYYGCEHQISVDLKKNAA